jgi:hypothetical protein
MKRKSEPQTVDPPEAQQQSRPIQSIALASGKTLERAPTTAIKPDEIPKRRDDRYYARHWGINE